MLKKILTMVLAIILTLSCVACSTAKEPEVTEPTVAAIPTNVFGTQADCLNYLIVGDQMYRLNAEMPDKFRQNGFRAGTDDTATALSLGYPKGDAQYLFYKCDDTAANCVYCCVVENKMTLTISYRVVDPSKFGVANAAYTTANSQTYYADYLTAGRTVDEVLSFMGTPDKVEKNDSDFVTKLVYSHKDAEDKVDNKVEIEFVGERLYKITIVKKLHE